MTTGAVEGRVETLGAIPEGKRSETARGRERCGKRHGKESNSLAGSGNGTDGEDHQSRQHDGGILPSSKQ